ncbi:unnamed protein product [Ectocarpus sp. 6 AP-2014]
MIIRCLTSGKDSAAGSDRCRQRESRNSPNACGGVHNRILWFWRYPRRKFADPPPPKKLRTTVRVRQPGDRRATAGRQTCEQCFPYKVDGAQPVGDSGGDLCAEPFAPTEVRDVCVCVCVCVAVLRLASWYP